MRNVIKRLLKRVVVTGVGAAAGVAAAGVFKRHQWLVVGVDSVHSPAHVHQFYVIASETHPRFREDVLLVVRREKSTLVLPTRPLEVLALAPYGREFYRLGASLYLPPPQVVEDLMDPTIWPRRLRRAGIAAEPSLEQHTAGDEQLYEVSLCADIRVPHAVLGCSVFALFPESSPSSSTFRAERRKDEVTIEKIARMVAAACEVRGLLTIHVRVPINGEPVIAGLAPTPCVYGPFSDEVYEALRALWERDQPS